MVGGFFGRLLGPVKSDSISSPEGAQMVQKPTQIEKDSSLSEGTKGTMLSTLGKSKLLQVLM